MREVALLSGERAAGLGRGGTADRAPRYWAFLSYSHKDSELADWLHGALESYRVPRSLVGPTSHVDVTAAMDEQPRSRAVSLKLINTVETAADVAGVDSDPFAGIEV